MFKQLLARDLKNRLSDGDDLVILDVREPFEHEESQIANSILIPLKDLPERFLELEPYREKEIVVYCKAGVRSQVACQFLAANGFKQLINLSDGILGWEFS